MTLGVNLVTPPAFEPVSLARARAWLTIDVDGFAGSTLLDPELESMIRASRQWVERETDRTIGLQHLVAFQDGFYGMGNLQAATLQGNYQLPIYGFERNYWQLGIELPRGPIRSIEQIRYLTVDGGDSAVDPAIYRLTQVNPQRVMLRAGKSWPIASLEPESVRIYYTAGYDVILPLVTVGGAYAAAYADGYADDPEGYANDYVDQYVGAGTVTTAAPATDWALGEDLVVCMRLLIGHYWRNREASVESLRFLETPFGVRALIAPNRASVGI